MKWGRGKVGCGTGRHGIIIVFSITRRLGVTRSRLFSCRHATLQPAPYKWHTNAILQCFPTNFLLTAHPFEQHQRDKEVRRSACRVGKPVALLRCAGLPTLSFSGAMPSRVRSGYLQLDTTVGGFTLHFPGTYPSYTTMFTLLMWSTVIALTKSASFFRA